MNVSHEIDLKDIFYELEFSRKIISHLNLGCCLEIVFFFLFFSSFVETKALGMFIIHSRTLLGVVRLTRRPYCMNKNEEDTP